MGWTLQTSVDRFGTEIKGWTLQTSVDCFGTEILDTKDISRMFWY